MIIEILLLNVLPLYGLILLGFVIGKTLKLDVDPIATIMLYAVLPFVMFGATATMSFDADFILGPLIIAFISITASSSAYLVSRYIWGKDDKRHNLLGLLGVSSNATYFGVPIAIALTDTSYLGLYMVMVLPLFMLDCTLSYFFGVRGEFNTKDSLIRVAKLPIIYGALFGLGFNFLNFDFSSLMLEYWQRFTGTMIILGMMMIGAALAQMERFRFDFQFFKAVALMRYILWPILGLCWVYLDMHYLHVLNEIIHLFIILICSCPLAANTVAYAAKLKLFPALTACMVLISTLLALGFIPIMMFIKDLL